MSYVLMSDLLAAKPLARLARRLQNGDVLAGVVVNRADFGLLIDIGGIVGLCHSAELRGRRETYAIGDRVTVEIIGVDPKARTVWLRPSTPASG